jgi:hypothetical protein
MKKEALLKYKALFVDIYEELRKAEEVTLMRFEFFV